MNQGLNTYLIWKHRWCQNVSYLNVFILVSGIPTPLKNHGVRQWEGWHPIYPIYEMENLKFMFETNQQRSPLVIWVSLAVGSRLPKVNGAGGHRHRSAVLWSNRTIVPCHWFSHIGIPRVICYVLLLKTAHRNSWCGQNNFSNHPQNHHFYGW